MKEKVRELWEICFEDEKAFVDLYFSRRYSDRINLAAEENGFLTAALQMIPYQMTYYRKLLPVSYISGACTHPAYRSKGLMKELLARSHRRMYEESVVVSTLIPAEPWLFDYYSKAGYTPAFYYKTLRLNAEDSQDSHSLGIEKYGTGKPEVYTCFDRMLSERNCCIQHSEEDFETILAALHLSGGELYVARRKEQIEGMVFCIPDGETLYVSEWIIQSGIAPGPMLRAIARAAGCTEIVYKIGKERQGSPKGMARIIRAESALRHYAEAHPDSNLTIRLSDEQLPPNNGCYVLKDGTCTKSSTGGDPGPVREMNIRQLSEFFFRNEPASMSLMLD